MPYPNLILSNQKTGLLENSNQFIMINSDNYDIVYLQFVGLGLVEGPAVYQRYQYMVFYIRVAV